MGTPLRFAAAAVLGLAACRPSRVGEADGIRPDSILERFAAAERAAFRRLPSCPTPTRLEGGVVEPIRKLRLPPSFEQDSGLFFYHGGARYRSGDTVVDVSFGHWGWPSFTGDYAGRRMPPAACRAGPRHREYLLTEATYEGRFHASAVHFPDTGMLSSDTRFGADAPRPMRAFLLDLLVASDTVAWPRR